MKTTRELYWAEFGNYLLAQGSPMQVGRYLPSTRTHAVEIKHPVGFERPGAHLAATALHQEPVIRANIVLEDDDSLTLFNELRAMSGALDLGHNLEFEGECNPRVRRIYAARSASYRSRDDWEQQFTWLRPLLERLYAVFCPLVR